MAKVNKIIQPVLPLRDIVVFPNMIVRLFVGREKSVKALEEVMKENKEILLVSQVDATQDEPNEKTINKIGVSAKGLSENKKLNSTIFKLSHIFVRQILF